MANIRARTIYRLTVFCLMAAMVGSSVGLNLLRGQAPLADPWAIQAQR